MATKPRPQPAATAHTTDQPAATATGTFAGQMVQQAGSPGSEWHRCDGSTFQPRAERGAGHYGGLDVRAYILRTGRFSGAHNRPNWRVRLPLLTGWWVALADNPGAAALPANTPTAQHPPPGTR